MRIGKKPFFHKPIKASRERIPFSHKKIQTKFEESRSSTQAFGVCGFGFFAESAREKMVRAMVLHMAGNGLRTDTPSMWWRVQLPPLVLHK